MRTHRGTASVVTATVAAVGASAILFSGASSATPSDSMTPDALTVSGVPDAPVVPQRVHALSCEATAELDRQSTERATEAGVSVPGPLQWPPIALGMDPDQPRPAVAPLDPTTGIPKDQLGGTIPVEVVKETRRREREEALLAPKEPRWCGAAVDALQRQAESTTGKTACYLSDGRFATTLYVDAVPLEPNVSPYQRPSRDSFDQICRHLGWDRSYP
ncbi:hypothetical protein [Rhodococcus sp. IEGM 1379]|uniref:hypothetical protein n=1 Tax=Rhodococcus sp. IEGM 1379 TaxID=3047086 RepID=UPI0024B6B7BA|nr:hypothetical protein [Rhodococcus sp. IEGM 1379]MDI9915511.1 hypothetical protein [Rhodococcus sp. IEGM 1379]